MYAKHFITIDATEDADDPHVVCSCGLRCVPMVNIGNAQESWNLHRYQLELGMDYEDTMIWEMYFRIDNDGDCYARIGVRRDWYTGEAYVFTAQDITVPVRGEMLLAIEDCMRKARTIAYIYNACREPGDTQSPYE